MTDILILLMILLVLDLICNSLNYYQSIKHDQIIHQLIDEVSEIHGELDSKGSPFEEIEGQREKQAPKEPRKVEHSATMVFGGLPKEPSLDDSFEQMNIDEYDKWEQREREEIIIRQEYELERAAQEHNKENGA